MVSCFAKKKYQEFKDIKIDFVYPTKNWLEGKFIVVADIGREILCSSYTLECLEKKSKKNDRLSLS